MDNFIDRLAHKWNASELIKANSAAEAMEAKRLREQVSQYEEILEEMRKVNLKNAELVERSRKLTEEGIREVAALLDGAEEERPPEKDFGADFDGIREQLAKMQELMEREDVTKEQLRELLDKTEDFVHKENVKVYRNVQAVFTEGLQAQKEELTKQNAELEKALKGIKPMLTGALVLLVLIAAMLAANIFGVI